MKCRFSRCGSLRAPDTAPRGRGGEETSWHRRSPSPRPSPPGRGRAAVRPSADWGHLDSTASGVLSLKLGRLRMGPLANLLLLAGALGGLAAEIPQMLRPESLDPRLPAFVKAKEQQARALAK